MKSGAESAILQPCGFGAATDSLYMIPPHTKAISKHSALSGEAASTGEGAVRFFCVNIPEMDALQG